jgi:hypothetical protein
MTPIESYHRYKNTQWYRSYRKKFEKGYREENRIMWNLKSWKSMRKKYGKTTSLKQEFEYLMIRTLRDL